MKSIIVSVSSLATTLMYAFVRNLTYNGNPVGLIVKKEQYAFLWIDPRGTEQTYYFDKEAIHHSDPAYNLRTIERKWREAKEYFDNIAFESAPKNSPFQVREPEFPK